MATYYIFEILQARSWPKIAPQKLNISGPYFNLPSSIANILLQTLNTIYDFSLDLCPSQLLQDSVCYYLYGWNPTHLKDIFLLLWRQLTFRARHHSWIRRLVQCKDKIYGEIQLKQIHITPPSQWPPSIKCEHLPYNLVRIANKKWKYHWDGLINTLHKNIFKNDHLQQSTHLQSDTETSCHKVYQIYAHHFTVFLNLKSDCTLNSLEPT